jgi:hypothetical protein
LHLGKVPTREEAEFQACGAPGRPRPQVDAVFMVRAAFLAVNKAGESEAGNIVAAVL